MFSSLSRLAGVVCCLALCAPAWCQNGAPGAVTADEGTIPALPDKLPLPPKDQAGFIVSLARDGRGDLWAGTEDKGVWRFDVAGKKWVNYRVKDGLGDDNVYAITVDLQGRVWVGHLNHGVSVWNGQEWHNYPVLQGPLGERVFALATSPGDGDVWMATNAGLSRYSPKSDSWTHFTEADGLPTHEISALAFDSVGNLYVGTQCDGLLIGKPDEGFKSWKQVKGADAMPLTAFGKGLPSNLINDVLVADDDTVYVATTCGLARSKDFGENWSFIRGEDWADKLKGLYDKPEVKPLEGALPGQLLREDYVTGLAEDPSGLLWISYRRRGYEIRRPLTDRVAFASAPQNPNEDYKYPYASTLLPLGDFKALVGTYSDGLLLAADVPKFVPTKDEQAAYDHRRGWRLEALTANLLPTTPQLPKAATLLSVPELEAMRDAAGAVPAQDDKTAFVVPLDEDWTTQGDWLGRYGRYWACLCAMVSPNNYVWGAGEQKVDYNLRIDPREKENGLRYWIHWASTSNRRALEMPPVYADGRVKLGLSPATENRRQSEVDDNGETYPLTKEGPDIYATMRIPAGLYTLSFYNHNKDGHDALNRMRDYVYSVRSHPENVALEDVSDFAKWPELAHSRQRDFWGGVYKRFLVKGPQTLTVRISKNNSLNTILAGIFLDEVNETPRPYFEPWRLPEPPKPSKLKIEGADAYIMDRLWPALEKARTRNPVWWATHERTWSVPLTRWFEAAKRRAPADDMPFLLARLGSSYASLNLYPLWEDTQRRRGLVPARDIETSLKFDEETIKYNGSKNFSGRGRLTVTGLGERQDQAKLAPTTTTKPTNSTK